MHKHIKQILLLLVHNNQLIFILTISWMELQQFSSSVMGSEKQLEFPLQVFCLARKLLFVFKILAGHFPTQLEQLLPSHSGKHSLV